ncbi:MCE family protein [Aeromicrobium sp. SMF47]|uniref:MCE family protein n=1 Tax=Aeromicrobium yanjiei TaxID=2662028 RepID=UPI00129D662D|nr:MCE family protein [Aeromicrobium yanjiei]MRJ76212.1 MCE family protein [Aeromicrobium yanjiei]
MSRRRHLRLPILTAVSALLLSGCGFSPYKLPLPGGADLGSEPYTVKIQFRDVLDLVPQSAVRVDDIAVGKVTDVTLQGWTAVVTVKVNRDAKLPDNAVATIRQTSLLGEKFVSLAPPPTGGFGSLGNGDTIPLDRAGRNPEIEEVLGAASLLFNGGGLEKTNTIIKELNNALGGNEPEVRELISSTSSFITQLDENKEALLTSLEKVDRLARATQKQRSAITGALDELPAALKVVNQQRDDLVGLLQSLDKLSNVATDVIARSKDDTVADLKALAPTLENLAKAGDDLASGTRALLTYPFTDGFVGNSVAAATGRCQDSPTVKEGACFGDFANLSLSLDLNADQLTNLLGLDLGELTDAPKAPADATEPGDTPASEDPLGTGDLADLLSGLLTGGKGSGSADKDSDTGPGAGSGGSGKGSGSPSTPAPATPKPTKPTSKGLLCGLFGSCRAPVADTASSDVERLLLQTAVAP